MSFPKITIARATVREVRRKRNLPKVETTFVTKDGPLVGTIWFDRETETRELMIVKQVIPTTINYGVAVSQKAGVVKFTSRPIVKLDTFMSRVNDGRYILVGIQNDYTPSRTEF